MFEEIFHNLYKVSFFQFDQMKFQEFFPFLFRCDHYNIHNSEKFSHKTIELYKDF